MQRRLLEGYLKGVKLCYIKAVKSFRGERKRLALLRAIVSNPTLIILDEPTAGLDPGNQELVWNMIEGIGRDVTRIVATHDVESDDSRLCCCHKEWDYCGMWES